MLRYTVGRVFAVIPMMIAVVIISFALVLVLELRGSVAGYVLGDSAGNPDAVAAVEAELGLDKNVFERFGSWSVNALQGDFGESLVIRNVSVTDLIGQRIWPTLAITIVGVGIAVLFGVLFGILSGLSPGKRADRVLSAVSAVMMSTPNFVVGLLLVAYFAVQLGWFEPTGYRAPSDAGWWAWAKSVTLPALALGLPIVAIVQRQLRSSMSNALQSRYVLAARARGVPRSLILWRHAMRNAMIPTVTVIGFWAASAIGLTIAVERVFAINGMGTLMVDAIVARDVPVVQGSLVVSAVVVAVVNLLVDLSYGWLNPKVRMQ